MTCSAHCQRDKKDLYDCKVTCTDDNAPTNKEKYFPAHSCSCFNRKFGIPIMILIILMLILFLFFMARRSL